MTTERDVEQTLHRLVLRCGGMCVKFISPGFTGVPDRLLLLPGGRAAFAEVKRPKGGRLSPMQEWWRNVLQDFGFPWFLVRDEKSLAEVELWIREVRG